MKKENSMKRKKQRRTRIEVMTSRVQRKIYFCELDEVVLRDKTFIVVDGGPSGSRGAYVTLEEKP